MGKESFGAKSAGKTVPSGTKMIPIGIKISRVRTLRALVETTSIAGLMSKRVVKGAYGGDAIQPPRRF